MGLAARGWPGTGPAVRQTRRMSRRGWVLFLAMSVIWGIPYLLIKVAVTDLSPAMVVFGRTGLAAVVLLPLAVRRGELAALRPVRWWVVLFAVVEICIPWIMLGYAELRLTSSLTALLLAAIPLVAMLFSRIAGLEHRIGAVRWIGLAVGIAGVAAVGGLDLGSGDVLSVGAVLCAVLGYAAGPLLIAKRLSGVSGSAVTAVSMTLNAAAYLPFAVWTRPAAPGEVPMKAWLAVVALGLICSALAFVLFFHLVAEVGPARTSVITYVNPMVAALGGTLVLGEPVTAGLLVGFPLVLCGSWLATRPAPR